ncbi:AAA ATPase and PIF1-like helicase domain protein [Metarhizium robertsii]|uniref:AAA ATPase and PIF1-like helicase domain protein n=1 Tax=Metarhizium robertsii TaxID=568076 RepID=A0A0A1UNL7_9HYPO|nr:AAA ATPase and PIF1-like helicase domain protein [Metarhizium robertsii]
MASAGHQEDAGPDGERCASSAVASESDTDYSWGWLDSDSGDPVVAALSSREARNETGVTTSIDAQRAHPQRCPATYEPRRLLSSGGGEERFDNAEPNLCQEQQDVVDLIASGRNIFFTGSAGCGKSTVLKAAVMRLQAMGLIVHVLAPTGRAATSGQRCVNVVLHGVDARSPQASDRDADRFSVLPIGKLMFDPTIEEVGSDGWTLLRKWIPTWLVTKWVRWTNDKRAAIESPGARQSFWTPTFMVFSASPLGPSSRQRLRRPATPTC